MYTIQFSYFTNWFYGDTEFAKRVSPVRHDQQNLADFAKD